MKLHIRLGRQFGQNGLYRDSPLYNFTENHDVNPRLEPSHAGTTLLTYGMLFTMPGIPLYTMAGNGGSWQKKQRRRP